MAFCKDFNARTQKYKPDTPMSVIITAFKDNTFEFTVRSPTVTTSKRLPELSWAVVVPAMSWPQPSSYFAIERSTFRDAVNVKTERIFSPKQTVEENTKYWSCNGLLVMGSVIHLRPLLAMDMGQATRMGAFEARNHDLRRHFCL